MSKFFPPAVEPEETEEQQPEDALEQAKKNWMEKLSGAVKASAKTGKRRARRTGGGGLAGGCGRCDR